MTTYLVTGCAGFIGTTFVHYMLGGLKTLRNRVHLQMLES